MQLGEIWRGQPGAGQRRPGRQLLLLLLLLGKVLRGVVVVLDDQRVLRVVVLETLLDMGGGKVSFKLEEGV